MRYDIEEQSYNTLKFREKLEEGSLLAYNTLHKKDIVVRMSNELPEIKYCVANGWELYPGKDVYILRAPEGSLVDLSEPFQNPSWSLQNMLIYFKLLKKIGEDELKKHIDRIYGKGVAWLVSGDSIEAEVRVACSSSSLLSHLPYDLHTNIKHNYTSEWSQLQTSSQRVYERLVRVRKTDVLDRKIFRIYSQWKNEYQELGFLRFPKPVAIHGIWDQLERKGYDVHIFVLSCGLGYALGYIVDGGNEKKIDLMEKHVGVGFRKMLFFRSPKRLLGKKVAIIDKVYSGRTLGYLSRYLKSLNPTIIGMFPKSRRFLKKIDYVFFLDKMINSKDVPDNENWVEELFIKVANNQIP